MVELNNPNLDCSILCQDQGQMQKCVFHIEMHIQFRVYLLLLFMVWNLAPDMYNNYSMACLSMIVWISHQDEDHRFLNIK